MTTKLKALREKETITVLAIESSCDETACAVVQGREILSNVISTQIAVHTLYGGVVPEIASRRHTLDIVNVVKEAVAQSGLSLKDVDAIGVTYGAGLLGALLIGVSYAKALSYALGVPLIGVNHIHGHIAANYLAHPTLEPPYVGLVVSGGHTAVLEVASYTQMRLLGSTQDDACGEAFDKIARVLGLPYPGGVAIDNLAKQGHNSLVLPRPYKGEEHLNFSYSGLKTAVINYIHNAAQKGEEICREDVACSFQCSAIDMLIENAVKACGRCNLDKIAVSGGVAANSYLREKCADVCSKLNISTYFPPKKLCTDNAAMIGCQAYYLIRSGIAPAPLSLDADASLRINDAELTAFGKAEE